MELFSKEAYQRALNEQFNRHNELMKIWRPYLATEPRPPWHIRKWNVFKSRVRRGRVWLGEKVAASSFDNDY